MTFVGRLTTRRRVRLAMVASAALVAAVGCRDAAVEPTAATISLKSSRPNLIFLLADDMRADAAGYTGNPIVQTPNLDELARTGVSFRNAYVTTPICAISRASIF